MGITLEMVIGVVVLTALGLLLTGPGMWSEKWGWSRLRGEKRDAAKPGGAPPPVERRPPPRAAGGPRGGS